MSFELYRLLITLVLSVPVVLLFACGVLYLITPKPNSMPDMAVMLFGVLIGLGAASGVGWLVPLLTHGVAQ